MTNRPWCNDKAVTKRSGALVSCAHAQVQVLQHRACEPTILVAHGCPTCLKASSPPHPAPMPPEAPEWDESRAQSFGLLRMSHNTLTECYPAHTEEVTGHPHTPCHGNHSLGLLHVS